MGSKYSAVFSPITIRGIDVRNRIELAPPSPNLATPDGKVSTEFINWFRMFARGGAGIINVGNSLIDYEACRDEARQLDISTDDCILPLSQYVEMAAGYGCLATTEINHNGMDANPDRTGRIAVSASSIITSAERGRAAMKGTLPRHTRELNYEEIQQLTDAYAQAALRCKRAGMKVAFIHGGHGNLISQFSSPLFNKRTDEYGGSLENRARFTVEVLDKVRKLCGEDMIIEMRVSADEILEGGMHFDETLRYIDIIQDKIDIIHVSAGIHSEMSLNRNWDQNYMMDQEFNVHFAADVKKAFPKLLVNTVGSIMSIEAADRIISEGKADFVSMCRPLMADPDMPRKYARGREDEHRPCLRCKWCGRRLVLPRVIACTVNPMISGVHECPGGVVPKADEKKRVAVVGGGPAGVQAALTLCERGHEVTLYEKADAIGGNCRYGAAAPFKMELRDYIAYLERMLKKSGARVLLNTEATPELLEAENYDALILANGASPIVPKNVPGTDLPHVYWAPLAETGERECGDTVVIVGGGTVGAECAINLGMQGKNVTLVEMANNDLNMHFSGVMRLEMNNKMDSLGIPRHYSHALKAITESEVICENLTTGETVSFPADTVLLATGLRSNRDNAASLRRCAPETDVYLVGDVSAPATIGEAVNAAFRAALNI